VTKTNKLFSLTFVIKICHYWHFLIQEYL